jgi:hypothetical protein
MTATPDPVVVLAAADAAYTADVLDLAGRFLDRAHLHDAGSVRSTATLTRAAARLLPPGDLPPRRCDRLGGTLHEYERAA